MDDERWLERAGVIPFCAEFRLAYFAFFSLFAPVSQHRRFRAGAGNTAPKGVGAPKESVFFFLPALVVVQLSVWDDSSEGASNCGTAVLPLQPPHPEPKKEIVAARICCRHRAKRLAPTGRT